MLEKRSSHWGKFRLVRLVVHISMDFMVLFFDESCLLFCFWLLMNTFHIRLKYAC